MEDSTFLSFYSILAKHPIVKDFMIVKMLFWKLLGNNNIYFMKLTLDFSSCFIEDIFKTKYVIHGAVILACIFAVMGTLLVIWVSNILLLLLLFKNWAIGVISRVFTNGPGDRGSIPG